MNATNHPQENKSSTYHKCICMLGMNYNISHKFESPNNMKHLIKDRKHLCSFLDINDTMQDGGKMVCQCWESFLTMILSCFASLRMHSSVQQSLQSVCLHRYGKHGCLKYCTMFIKCHKQITGHKRWRILLCCRLGFNNGRFN